jgi:porphobilinogen deaminase
MTARRDTSRYYMGEEENPRVMVGRHPDCELEDLRRGATLGSSAARRVHKREVLLRGLEVAL